MSRTLLLLASLTLVVCALCGPSGARPTVLVYTGGEDQLASMLAELVQAEQELGAETLIVTSPEAVSLACAMPSIACILIYADHRNDLLYLPLALVAFFEGGGGLVGLREVCYEPSAAEMAIDVFPIHGNQTTAPPAGTKRAFTYVLDRGMEIAEGLPEAFDVLSLGTYTSVDSEGNLLEIPGDHRVVYRDLRIGVPLVVAHESKRGGRSVAMPGIMVVSNQRVDVYYGNLFRDENFTRLLTNSIAWAMGNSRFAHLEEVLEDKIREFSSIQNERRTQADQARKERRIRRTYALIAFWAVGLAACGGILVKLILPAQDR